MIKIIPFVAAAALLAAAPAVATVAESSESGFTVSATQKVSATPEQLWAALIQPARWWSPAHSWSGNASNFTLDPVVGGCFCERWSANGAEHARIVFIAKNQLLRLRGSFGPLQSEALTGVLSITIKPDGKGASVTFDYVVGGHARFALNDIAPAVDGVIAEQASRLAALFPPSS